MTSSAHEKRRGQLTAAACECCILPREMGKRLVGLGHGWTFSRRAIAVPSLLYAATSSSASFWLVVRPFFSRTAIRIQRMANDCCRVRFTCIGTW